MPVVIREMNWRSDREAVLSFQQEVYETNFPGFRISGAFLRDYEQQLRQALRTASERLLVLDHDGEVAGFLWLALLATAVDPCVGYIKNVYVAPQLRGQGYGRRLLEVADEWFRANGCRRGTLDASVCNERAVEIYENAGYRPVRYRMEKIYPDYLDEDHVTGEMR